MNTAWAWRPLGELFKIDAGKTMSATARKGTDKTPFLRTSNVLWDEVSTSSVDEMSIPEHELPAKLLKPGDLLVCEGGEIGRAAIWNGKVKPMSFQNHLHRLRPVVPNVESRFYVFFLQCAFTQLHLFDGEANKTTIPNLSRSRLASLDVPQPPLGEQQAIVAALSQIRGALKGQNQAIAVTQELKHTALHNLFTHGLRSEDQKETEIGSLPESWDVSSLDKHFSVATGGTPSRRIPELWKHGTVPWVKTTEIKYNIIQSTEEHITQAGLEQSSAKMFPAGTLLLAMYGQGVTRGKVAILGIEATCNQACAAIQPRNLAVDTKFLYHFLTYRYDSIRQLAHGGQQQNLSLQIIRGCPIAVPSIVEQRVIVTILDSIDHKINHHQRKKAVLEELFKVLLHKLMTGEIRVGALELAIRNNFT